MFLWLFQNGLVSAQKHLFLWQPVENIGIQSRFSKNQSFALKCMATKDAFWGSGVSWLIQIMMMMLGASQVTGLFFVLHDEDTKSLLNLLLLPSASLCCLNSSLSFLGCWLFHSCLSALLSGQLASITQSPGNVSGSALVN